MTIEVPRRVDRDRGPVLADLPSRGRVLVRSSKPPRIPGDRYVDVRPGGVATFDGDHVRLSLTVTDGRAQIAVDWSDLATLEAAVTSMRSPGDGGVVRFGDRAACRSALGTAGVEAIERRLAAADGTVTLVTWTVATPRSEDARAYDTVIDGAGTNPG